MQLDAVSDLEVPAAGTMMTIFHDDDDVMCRPHQENEKKIRCPRSYFAHEFVGLMLTPFDPNIYGAADKASLLPCATVLSHYY